MRDCRAVVGATACSLSGLAAIGTEVTSTLSSPPVKRSLDLVVRPKSLAGGMKKIGVALLAVPDPFTDIPGAALLASSYALKKREPASLADLAQETRKLLRDIQYLRL
jgi:hypothetical protein